MIPARRSPALAAATAAAALAAALPACDRAAPSGASAPASESAPPVTLTDTPLPAIPGVDLASFDGRSAGIMAMADPLADTEAWDSEARSSQASDQLKKLASLLAAPDPPDPDDLAPLVADAFSATGLPDPAHLEEIHHGEHFQVARPPEAATAPPEPLGLADFVDRLRLPHQDDGPLRVALKNFRIDPGAEGGDGFTTTALFQSASGRVQQNAEWTCRWSHDSPPRLREVRAADHRRVHATLHFADTTGSVFADAPTFLAQMTTGARHWADRIQKFHFIDSTGHQGIAVGDADGDGLDDIYLAQQGGLPNRLYLRNPDGSLREAPPDAGVDWMELTHGVLFADLDNDGDQDLVLAQSDGILVMRNRGDATFEPSFRFPGEASFFSVTAADHDLDGDLDLFACGYNPRRLDEHAEGARANVPLPYHDSRNGGPNVLLRNEGDGTFTDATAAAGLAPSNDRHSFAAAWEDFDKDGDPDLYVANDFGRNNLYRNDGGTFTDVAAELGVEDMSAGMGVAWGDFDRDGWMDLHVSNMFSAAGNRIAYQRQFRTTDDPAALAGFRRHARGNSLFRNAGGATPFVDVSVEAGITMGRWAWGAVFADLDNDGWEDLHVANGYISADPKDDL